MTTEPIGADAGATTVEVPKDRLVMEHLVSLTYSEPLTPNLQRFADQLEAGSIVGHRGTSGLVFVPGRGYDLLTLDPTTEADEVRVADTGTITGFTIVTPVQYYGQQETKPFVLASVLLDGADTPIGQQAIVNVPHSELRVGMRVRAIWRPPAERAVDGLSNRGHGTLHGVIDSFEPTGEPDADATMTGGHTV